MKKTLTFKDMVEEYLNDQCFAANAKEEDNVRIVNHPMEMPMSLADEKLAEKASVSQGRKADFYAMRHKKNLPVKKDRSESAMFHRRRISAFAMQDVKDYYDDPENVIV